MGVVGLTKTYPSAIMVTRKEAEKRQAVISELSGYGEWAVRNLFDVMTTFHCE